MNLRDARILITGASGGIGTALATRLRSEGSELLLHSHASALDCDENAVRADMTTVEGRQEIVRAATSFNINVLINCCGVNQFSCFEQADIEYIMQVNVIGPMLLTQSLIGHLRQRSQATILNVGSTLGEIGFPGYVAYCASKHAIKGFSESLRRELSDTHIRVQHVSPRAVHTEMNPERVHQLNQALGNKVDEPQFLADKIARQLERGRSRLQIGGLEKIQVKINGLVPRLVDLALSRQLATIKQYF